MASKTDQALFETRNHHKFDIGCPNFEKPVEIGCFSLDMNRELETSRKSMRYFVKPPNPKRVNFDLRKGYDTMIKNKKGRELNILNILRWIVDDLKEKDDTKGQEEGASGLDRSRDDEGNSKLSLSQGHLDDQTPGDQELSDVQRGLGELKIAKEDDSKTSVPLSMSTDGIGRTINTEFVCRRGLLAKVMSTPYEEKEEWLISVILHKGTYYLNEIETEQKKEYEANLKDDEMSCWGWKFEQYLTADSRDGVPNTDVPYNNCEAFYTVVRTQLNNHSLVFSGEVDAQNIDKEKGSYYMEFKTTREFAHQGHVKTFKRFKAKKWWAQSYIMGVQEIVCGFRNDKGIVSRLEFYNTEELPDIAKDIYNPWKPNVCFNFLDQFLTFIKSNIKTDDHKIVHVLKWSPGKPVQCSQPLSDSEHNFLPDWYTDFVK